MARSAAAPSGVDVVVGPTADQLVDALIARLRSQVPDDPFAETTIVVHSRGMGRWLSHRLADRLADDGSGIAANLDIPFPGELITRIAAACGIDDVLEPWQPRRLAWHVARVLWRDRGDAALGTLRRTPGPATHVDRSTWNLGRSIADVFNEYALARADMVARWRDGDDVDATGRPLGATDRWQPELWRRLVAELGDPTRDFDRTLDVLAGDGGQIREALPTGAHVFGISVLPPRLFDVLVGTARHVDVTWYVPAVSPQQWADAVRDDAAVSAHHPLVATNGRLTADSVALFARAAARGDLADVTVAGGGAPTERTVLGRVQAAIRTDRSPPASPPLHERDATVQIHGAHSDMRQAEIVRDAVLAALDEDAALEPRDVMILVPDAARFGPLITAAFAGDGQRPDVPVVVADRRRADVEPLAESLLALLRLASSRVTATEVVDVFARDPVARRFGLTSADTDRARSWIAGAGIRWGIDEHDRVGRGQPRDRHHTWRGGLDRLLLGVALADEDDRIVGGVVPYDDVEGDDVEVLARVSEAIEAVLSAVETLRTPRSLDEWSQVLPQIVDQLFAVDNQDTWRRIELDDAIEVATTATDVIADVDAIGAAIADELDIGRAAGGYETGAVTVCELLPMRSIPHEVVAVLGLDDGAYPRPGRRYGFDLVDRAPSAGDRDRRAEDRHLFLEALLSARRRFIATATMRDVRTNAPIVPSIVLTELIEVLDMFEMTPSGPAGMATVRHHALHAHSPSEFGTDPHGPVSFDAAAFAAAVARDRPADDTGLTTDALALGPRTPPREHTLRAAARALANPTRYLLEDRLGVVLHRYVEHVDDTEPLQIPPGDRAALIESLRHQRRAVDIERWRAAKVAAGTVPAGTPGIVALDDLVAVVDALDRRLHAECRALGVEGEPVDATLSVDVAFGEQRLRDTVVGVRTDWGALVVHVDPRADAPERRLDAWLAHLATSVTHGAVATVAARRPDASGRPQMHRFAPLATERASAQHRARQLLDGLADVVARADRELIPLFAHASSALARRGMADARRAFTGDGYAIGDRDDYVAHVYGADVTLDDVLEPSGRREQFARLAEQVWGPLLAARVSRRAELEARVDDVRSGAGA
ncbi:MAG: exodeoxyribonuclease V subunit gamma [Nitriliruptoraceae bacterium]